MSAGENKNYKKMLGIAIGAFAILLLAILLVANINALNKWCNSMLLLLRPILIGLALAYICNPIFRFLERKILYRVRPQGFRRVLSLTLTYIFVLLIVCLFFCLIFPQLIASLVSFFGNYESYLSSAISQINKLYAHINLLAEKFTGNETLIEYLNEQELIQKVADMFGNLKLKSAGLMEDLSDFDFKPIQAFFSNAISIVTDIIFGVFVSIYLLSTKEKRYAQIMKLRHAMFSDAANEHITRFCTALDKSFGGWVEGKLLDCLIIGVLAYIATSVFRIPYAILISTLIAVANIIPVIGPIIGAIPTSFILLLSAPAKLIPFLIIVLLLQQIDSNIITPKILGSNVGISSFCVLVAITSMGALWGPIGMILGVPLFASALTLADIYLTERLQKKGLPSGLANYYSNDAIVDPTKHAYLTMDKSVQKFEKKAFYIRKKAENGEALKRREKLLLTAYRIVHKYHFLSEMSDETQVRSSAEQAEKAIKAEAEDLLKARKTQANAAPETTD